MPLFLVILASAVVGLVIGFVWEWLREHKHRKVARVGRKQVASLSREVSQLREAKAEPRDEVLTLLDEAGRARRG